MSVKDQERCMEEMGEPVSPTGLYFNSSIISVTILAIFETDAPIDDSPTMTMLRDVFLPVSPRFSSIMVRDEHGTQRWKRVEVNLKEHVNVPIFPEGLSRQAYDECFKEYLSKIGLEKLPQNRPLWDIHIIKYPTNTATGALVIRLHHALGDGFSLMGALFSCVRRSDDPSLPLTFPSSQLKPQQQRGGAIRFLKKAIGVLPLLFNTVTEFSSTLLKSNWLEDDKSPIRSGTEGVEFLPVTISTLTFSLHHIRQVKNKLRGTVNDVITGIVFYGTRLYMQKMEPGATKSLKATALVLISTRIIKRYQSLGEMAALDNKSPWGNQATFLDVSVPPCSDAENANPLDFVSSAKRIIQRKKNSLSVYLTAMLLDSLSKFKGPEATAKFIHRTIKNSSMSISNLIGPIEEMSIANHPVKSLYFANMGTPHSLTLTMVSYKGELKMAVAAETGHINSQLLLSCMEGAFARIYEAAIGKPLQNFD